jgi:hypothetical protein
MARQIKMASTYAVRMVCRRQACLPGQGGADPRLDCCLRNAAMTQKSRSFRLSGGFRSKTGQDTSDEDSARDDQQDHGQADTP